MINLTTDQTQWLLAFFVAVSGLLMAYTLNLDKKMDKIKKEKKESRNKIKRNIEGLYVYPVMQKISSIFYSKLCSMGIDHKDTVKVEEVLDSLFEVSQSWTKLYSQLRLLGERTKEISNVDSLFNKYMMYNSYLTKILFLFTSVIFAIIPVYVFGGLITWMIWAIAFIQVSICLCIIKWKACKASSRFDTYEDLYITSK